MTIFNVYYDGTRSRQVGQKVNVTIFKKVSLGDEVFFFKRMGVFCARKPSCKGKVVRPLNDKPKTPPCYYEVEIDKILIK